MRLVDIFEAVEESFTDIGHVPADKLVKGFPLKSPDEFRQVSGRIFFNVLSHIKSNDFAKLNRGLPSKGLDTLSTYSIKEYDTMKCFIGLNNSSGFAVKENELVSVFSSQRSSGHSIVEAAIINGATHLDCFAFREHSKLSGPLYFLYSMHGFKLDTSLNSGNPNEPYAIVNGISSFVDDQEQVRPEDPRVVIFMKL